MKNLIIYFLLLLSISTSFSQKREIITIGKDTIIDIGGEEIEIDLTYVKPNLFVQNLKKLDTIYIYFKHGNNEIKILSNWNSPKQKRTDYLFNFKNGHHFRFLESKYLNLGFDRELADIKIKEKEYLRKNKKEILTYKILDRNVSQLRNVYEILRDKPVYLIDCKEIKKRKIILRQITLFSDYFTIE